jgi:hypothetical protein
MPWGLHHNEEEIPTISMSSHDLFQHICFVTALAEAQYAENARDSDGHRNTAACFNAVAQNRADMCVARLEEDTACCSRHDVSAR